MESTQTTAPKSDNICLKSGRGKTQKVPRKSSANGFYSRRVRWPFTHAKVKALQDSADRLSLVLSKLFLFIVMLLVTVKISEALCSVIYQRTGALQSSSLPKLLSAQNCLQV